MTLPRWFAVAALACLAIAAAYLPPQPEDRRYAPPEKLAGDEARLELVNRAFQQTRDQLAELRFRDSLRVALRQARMESAGVEMVIRGSLPEESHRAVRDALERVTERARIAPGARLLVVLETTAPSRQPMYVLPAALDGRTCVASLALDWRVAWLKNRGARTSGRPPSSAEDWLIETLGPCLYYATFGQPGPHIEAWLHARSFKVANIADWDVTPAVETLPEPRFVDMIVWNMSFDALACTDGQLERCRSAVMRADSVGVRSPRVRSPHIPGVVRRAYWPRSFPLDDHYLSAMVREMGRERFARFWRSTAPVDSAFVAAFGTPMQEWTAKWSRAFLPGLPPFGPAPRPRAVFFALILAVVAIAAAAAGVRRRQVS